MRCVVDPRVVVEPRTGDGCEGGVDRRLLEGEQALLPDQIGVGKLASLILADRTHVRNPYVYSAAVIEIADLLDPRLDDYRGLRERGKESDDYFIVEGLTAIERLLTSLYPVRSVLLTPVTHPRIAERLGTATTYVISVEAMSGVAGVNLHAVQSLRRPGYPARRSTACYRRDGS